MIKKRRYLKKIVNVFMSFVFTSTFVFASPVEILAAKDPSSLELDKHDPAVIGTELEKDAMDVLILASPVEKSTENNSLLFDLNAPTVVSTDPEKRALDIPVDKSITVSFSENIVAGPNYEKIKVQNPKGKVINYRTNINDNLLIIDPVDNFEAKAKYKVTIPSKAVQDINGNFLKKSLTFEYTTGSPEQNEEMSSETTDEQPPVIIDPEPVFINPEPDPLLVITATNPLEGSRDVNVDLVLTVTFNGSVTEGNEFNSIILSNAAGDKVDLIKSISNNTLKLKPSGSLNEGAAFKLLIPSGAVKNYEENTLEQDFHLNFTTVGTPATSNNNHSLFEAEANAQKAVENAQSRLENMRQAYQTWSIRQPLLDQNAINAKTYGVVGNGVTNDTAKIQELINSVSEYCTIFFPAGRYKINGTITFAKGITLAGEPGTVFDCSTATSDIFRINQDGYSHSKISVRENVSPGDTAIQAVDTSALKTGDYIKITDGESIDNRNKGEILRVLNISEDTIILEKPVIDGYLVNKNASVRQLTIAEEIIVTGFEFIGPGEETEPFLFRNYLVKNFSIQNCKMSDFGRTAVGLTDCLDSRISGNVFENIFKTGFGYSVLVTNASDNTVITENFFTKKGRHYIATGSATGTYLSGGFPKQIIVENNYFENSTTEAVNTHSPFSGPIIICNNVFINCAKGVEIINGKSTVAKNDFLNCKDAVNFYGLNSHHSANNNVFINNNRSIYTESSRATITGNVLQNSRMTFISPESLLVENNFFSGLPANDNPIEIKGSNSKEASNINLKQNIIINCDSSYAVKTQYANDINCNNNILKKSGRLYFNNSTNITIDSNITYYQSGDGIYIKDGSVVNIYNNSINSAGSNPLHIESTMPNEQPLVVKYNKLNGTAESVIINYTNVVHENNDGVIIIK